MKVLADTCNGIYCKIIRFSALIIFSFIFSFFAIVCQAFAHESSEDWFIVGDRHSGSALAEAVQLNNIPAETEFLSSDTDDLRISLNNVRVSNGLLQFELITETSDNVNQSGESNTKSYMKSETIAFTIPQLSEKTKWESIRISFDGLFFTFSDGRSKNCIVPFDGYNWSFVFHNPEVSRYTGPTVDELGIHTFGSDANIWLGRSAVIFDKLYLHLITKSTRLNDESMEERLWVNGKQQDPDQNLMNLIVSDEAHFTRRDQFELSLPKGFLSMVNLSVWTQNTSFELSYYDEAGNLQTWSESLAAKDDFPKQIIEFVHPEARLPMPEDEALYSVTANGVTMDIVSLDIVSVPESRRIGIWTETGINEILQVGLCFTAVDDGEWMMIPANAKSGEREIMANTLTPGGMTPATAEHTGRVCGTLGYDVMGLSLTPQDPLTIIVQSLLANPREGSPCKNILHRFETNAAVQALDVTLSCSDDISSETIRGPKDYTLSIQSYDSTKWTKKDVLQEVEKLLGFRIDGPWVFDHTNNLFDNK